MKNAEQIIRTALDDEIIKNIKRLSDGERTKFDRIYPNGTKAISNEDKAHALNLIFRVVYKRQFTKNQKLNKV